MRASARIQVTLDVPINDTWNDGTDIAQIREQAVRSGVKKLFGSLQQPTGGISIVGEPKVTIVLVEEV